MKFLIQLLICCILMASCSTKKQVDTIVHHATMYTVDSLFSKASTLIINKGKIIAIGGDTLLDEYQTSNSIDATNQFVYPGFIDAHCHFSGQALDTFKLKLFGTNSFEQVIEKLVGFSKHTKHFWIEGTGWDQNDWVNKQYPTKDTLDKLFPNIPVFLLRVDGHAALVNQKALDMANINLSTNIRGGVIEQKQGKLTGIVIDEAMSHIQSIIPTITEKDKIEAIISAQDKYFNVGLTSIVECGVSAEVAYQCKKAIDDNKLKLRTTLMLNADEDNLSTYLSKPIIQTDEFHIAGFKIFADGSLGSRGAFLKDDYCDKLGVKGSLRISVDSISNIASRIAKSRYQLCVHAIGDQTNHEVLTIFGKYLSKHNDRRWRIEHAQVVQDADMPMFKEFSIIPSVQPTHATSDMPWVEERLGKSRMPDAYAYKELLQQNNWLPLGTDYPVENLNPLYTFYAAIFRMDKNQFPKQGFQMENALSREEALRGVTIWAAKSVFEENLKGSLEVGKLADFVILDTDLMKAEPKQVYDANVLATYINGNQVYKNQKANKH